MHYLLFNNDFYLSDELEVKKIDRELQFKTELESIDEVNICIVDVDVELASAPESQTDKKDSILARKFSKLHPQDEYILQDEKIDDNIYQVMGAKTDKIREIYSLIPSDKVRVFIPYAIAIRNFLMKKNVELKKGIIFIDELGEERLITVFSNLKFSVTRTLTTTGIENILPEIRRSQIGFSKKIEEFDNWKQDSLTVLTNSKVIESYFLNNHQNINIEYINVQYPSIEGLKGLDNSENFVKFLLPEEIKNKKRKKELKEKAITFFVSLLILTVSLSFALLNKIKLSLLNSEFSRLNKQNQVLEEKLADLDLKTYREDLKQQKSINYATPYLEILNTLPLSYKFILLDIIKLTVGI